MLAFLINKLILLGSQLTVCLIYSILFFLFRLEEKIKLNLYSEILIHFKRIELL